MDKSKTSWVVPDQCCLLWEQFDNGTLIFNPLSGTTHLLFEPAVTIIQLLQQKQMTFPELIQGLDFGLEVGEESLEIEERVWQILLDLDKLGIVHPTAIAASSIIESAVS
ncbi:MAG: HPr-rel-A system PqqD family peptide chaperone [Magnetococcales bacterium]|nr:HPr-rel-A system PqqD family peptide chaperone [Magnetococcales bacterium]